MAPKLPAYTTSAATTEAIWLRSTAPRPSPKTPQATNATRFSSTERATVHPASDILTCWGYRNGGVLSAAMIVPTNQNSAPQHAAPAAFACVTPAPLGTRTNEPAALWVTEARA